MLASFFLSLCDAPEAWQINLQDPATPEVEGMLFFHNYLLLFLTIISIFVVWMLYIVIIKFNEVVNSKPQKFTHYSLLEIIWTAIPAFILLLMAIPSFSLLYALDELIDPSLTLKIIGHQWYWSYEYSDYSNATMGQGINFDSYIVSTDELTRGAFRLLEVDNRIILPILTHIRLLITSVDVLHSWAVPSFGIKVDACPGRLSQASLFLKRDGVFYGQCSEICGVNHGFMPITVAGVTPNAFLTWVCESIEDQKSS